MRHDFSIVRNLLEVDGVAERPRVVIFLDLSPNPDQFLVHGIRVSVTLAPALRLDVLLRPSRLQYACFVLLFLET